MCKENLYKHIIWVDDFDDKNTTLSNIPTADEWDEDEVHVSDRHDADIKLTFGDKYAEYVKLFMNIPDVLEFIDNNLNLCDCIVLDVNLNKALDSVQKDKINKICEKKGIKINKEIGKYGGYYIFLYLLKSGFPTERICIFTGNKGDDNSTGVWERAFLDAGIYPPESINRTDTILLQKWIDNCYTDQYYRTRRLVYKACEYWKEKLISMKKENIPFNQIYYLNPEENESSIESAVFVSMLERIEMLYPVTLPKNCEAIYYQALQVATIFHEESAKITILDKDSPLRKYHQAVRNYRNWSAHNKFDRNEISAELFSYMLCLTLRTYFQAQENQFLVNQNGNSVECYRIYEKEFFDRCCDDCLDANLIKEKYKNAFNRHLDKVKIHDKKSKGKNDRIPLIYECKNINELLLCSGNVNTLKSHEKMNLSDLLLNIIDGWIVQGTKYGCENSDNGWEYKVEYHWDTEISDADIQSAIKCKDDYFKFIAYVLFEKTA